MDTQTNINSTECFLDCVLQAIPRELQDTRHLQQVVQLHYELQLRLYISAWPIMQALIEKIFIYKVLENQMKRTITKL